MGRISFEAARSRLQPMAAMILCLVVVYAPNLAHAEPEPPRTSKTTVSLEPATGNLALEIAGGLSGTALGVMLKFGLRDWRQHPCGEHNTLHDCSLNSPLARFASGFFVLSLPSAGVLLAGRATGGNGLFNSSLLASVCAGLIAVAPAVVLQVVLNDPQIVLPIVSGGMFLGSLIGYRRSARPVRGSRSRAELDIYVSDDAAGASAGFKLSASI
jgi:hypothetical protein